jgi:lysophospholipid acyltransferase (LPLAT)-like uncharacterized protein
MPDSSRRGLLARIVLAVVQLDPKAAWFWRTVVHPFAALLDLATFAVQRTSRIEVVGPARDHAGPAVHVFWHRHLPYLSVHHGERHRWMLVSRGAYMQTMARWCEGRGLRLARGTVGDGGRTALRTLRGALETGDAVAMAVDGPAGPAFRAKRGCVELAREAGVPLIPVAYSITRGFELPRWDAQLIPAPFGRVRIVYGEPIAVGDRPTREVLAELHAALDALDPASRAARAAQAARPEDQGHGAGEPVRALEPASD